MRSFTLAFALALLAIAACGAPARAAVEFCPAKLDNMTPIGGVLGTAVPSYVYELTALAPRTVDASLVADTDKGWFAWHVSNAQLQEAKRVQANRFGGSPYTIAASAPLDVTFPEALAVRHAWVVSADVPGKSPASCDVPAFPSANMADPPPNATVSTPSPLPSPVSAAATATTTTPPFSFASCEHPFAQAKVTTVTQPQFPDELRGALGGRVSAALYIALDPKGNVIDTWPFSTSGFPLLDQAALRAARSSTYSGAISYCRPVNSLYLFRAVFAPR
ncbi:MAG TPA: hypothetical protein VNG31_00050 [Candidatus Baltobacteraceae bacterium]|nr:hypothetical protein [Candidatus Baltobacteraceae bacterium]